jgi:glutathione S-transferase
MALELFGHPFSSYTWKALIPLYENDTPFTFRMLEPDQPENGAALAAHWPIGKFPLLVDDGVPVFESSTIIEYLDLHHPGSVRFIPEDRVAALEVRTLDRVFDNHVMTPMQAVVAEHLPFLTPTPDAARIARARDALDKAYGWLDTRLAGRNWAAGEDFTLADCAGAPALFYADWVQEIPASFDTLCAYRARVLAHPSVARCVEEARPYRPYFPLGAPDRD